MVMHESFPYVALDGCPFLSRADPVHLLFRTSPHQAKLDEHSVITHTAS